MIMFFCCLRKFQRAMIGNGIRRGDPIGPFGIMIATFRQLLIHRAHIR